MRYAQLDLIQENNFCTKNEVIREQLLEVKSCGAIELTSGVTQLHPFHIGRKIIIKRNLTKTLDQQLTFVS